MTHRSFTRPLILAATSAALIAGTTGCSTSSEPHTLPATTDTNDAPATIITMPDGYSSVAGKCDGTTYVYVIRHGDNPYGDLEIVPDDPRCSDD